jgi:hypothetical protein
MYEMGDKENRLKKLTKVAVTVRRGTSIIKAPFLFITFT